CQQDYNYSF
nr:immunoglobulin light chain junction region [Macaca mulatta]MOV81425.1 immunoglobulin light chain junction region [Macaca mulatta]